MGNMSVMKNVPTKNCDWVNFVATIETHSEMLGGTMESTAHTQGKWPSTNKTCQTMVSVPDFLSLRCRSVPWKLRASSYFFPTKFQGNPMNSVGRVLQSHSKLEMYQLQNGWLPVFKHGKCLNEWMPFKKKHSKSIRSLAPLVLRS